ncbi:MAG: SAM-dependent methyltransferase, partial [Pseudomonadota bacterium]
YIDAGEAAGLMFKSIRNRKEFAEEFFDEAFARLKDSGGPPPIGIHLLMRETASAKLQNYVTCLKGGKIAPFELIFRKPI